MRLICALAALPAIALAQVVTVREYAGSCKATYTTAVTYTATSSGSRTSTVVQSTVTVVPTPFTDSSINQGTPFVVEIQPGGYSKNKRQAQGARTFLDADGYLTSNASEAVQYVINNGQVRISGGQGQITANETDLSVPFAASTTLKPIRTMFYSASLQLGWNNSAFQGGAAEFFQVRAGTRTRIMVHLNGVHDASWIAVNFALQPTSDLVQSSTLAPVTSATGSLSIQPISSTTASALAIPSGNVDPTGACGVGTNNNNCFGAPAGSCCSQYGFCGTGPAYCGIGCQASFGTCNSVQSSAVPTMIAGSSSRISIPTAASSASVQPPAIGSSTSTREVYSNPVGTSNTPSQYPTIASEEPWYTEPIGTPSFSLVETGSSIAPIYSSLASSYASSISSEASSSSSVISSQTSSSSSFISSVPSSSNGAPSYQAPPSAPATSASPASSVASSGSSVSSSVYSAAASLLSSRTSSFLSSVSSAASSATSSASSAAQPSPINTAQPSTTSLRTTTPSSIASITSSGSAPAGTGVGRCPDDDGLLATDSNGVQYVVRCSADFRGMDLSSTRITSPYSSCYTLCDGIPNCGGYIWAGIDGSTNGLGTGYCYFKSFSGQGNFVPAANTLVAVIKPTFISGYTAPTNAPPASTSNVQATPTPEASTPVVSPSQASSCAVTAVPNQQFYASAPASRASSWLVLPSPTPCPFIPASQDWPLDDDYCELNIPQGVELYTSRFTTMFASTNGVLSLNTGGAQYENQRLNVATDFIPTFALAPFWDDQAMWGDATPKQGIYYQADNTGVTVEYYLSRPYLNTLVFHYTVSYSFANPGVWVFSYFDVDAANNDNGIFATVGMQGAFGNDTRSFEYSYKTRSIYPGLVLTCDSNTNLCTSCSQQISG